MELGDYRLHSAVNLMPTFSNLAGDVPAVITFIEKTLTGLAMPCGLIWLGLIALTFLSWRRKQRAIWISLAVFLGIYTLAGNSEFGKVLMARLEQSYVEIDPFEQGPYDAVFVLGGGISVAVNDVSQLDLAGDRVGLAARLYHTGRTQQLVALGSITGTGDLAEETSQIWGQWAVPEDAIGQAHGRNTREEMAAIRQMVSEHPEWKRLGLITSAWHMRRAMRLAKKNELTLEPLPANFRGTPIEWTPWALIIPCSYGFQNSQLACKEFLAGLVGK